MSAIQSAIYWFGNDCRIQDNPLLEKARLEADQLFLVYLPYLQIPTSATAPLFNQAKSDIVTVFEQQSLNDLAQQLSESNQQLFNLFNLNELAQLIEGGAITHLYRAHHPGYDEQQALGYLAAAFPQLEIIQADTLSLLSRDQVADLTTDFPATFTQFKKRIPSIELRTAANDLTDFPSLPEHTFSNQELHWLHARSWQANSGKASEGCAFMGGETAATKHIAAYFASEHPSSYKLTRNRLIGFESSSKLSPWLSNGNLSIHRAWLSILEYEQRQGRNESTEWLQFELLWREFFFWYADKYQQHLFALDGPHQKVKPWQTSRNDFIKWQQGQTGFAIVDAAMRELNSTGFISNRARQLAASCLIHELQLDWRLGAVYFERNLLDYDVGSNWGNWQYIAGVGADARPVRRFDLEKQTQMYDPQHAYIDHWLVDSK
jgi:deoxyribodipyrimidine photo-lyase